MREYYVYILTNKSGTLYTGMTNDLTRRIWEHKKGDIPGFTENYRVNRLLYFEMTGNVNNAIAREKQIKGWSRKKKIELIQTLNPKWENLSLEWFENTDSSLPSE